MIVSIHAPARGRTGRLVTSLPSRRFNPRPRAGANQCRSAQVTVSRCFNPRPRAGANTRTRVIIASDIVSIHAPARGRTMALGRIYAEIMFQSTPPRGGERPDSGGLVTGGSFNPRPRAGANVGAIEHHSPVGVSFHAPARGRTLGHNAIAAIIKFQSTPPRGGERSRSQGFNRCNRFQSTPPRGGEQAQYCRGREVTMVSIHAPARGRTPRPSGARPCAQFQSTPPRGGER